MAEKRPIRIDDFARIAHVEGLDVSPDGDWIAFVKVTVDLMENGYKRNIWLVSTKGGAPYQITRSGKDSAPRFSPDGKQLGFVSGRNEKPQVYTLSLAAFGGEPRAITSATNGAFGFDWSPDGSQIAYLSAMNPEEIVREDRGEKDPEPADSLDAKQKKERKDHDEKMRFEPRYVWRIPYREGTAFRDDRRAQIYIMPTADGLEGEEAKPRRLTSVDADHEPPTWSPDGKSLYTARTARPEGDEPWRSSILLRIDVASGAQTDLTDNSVYTCFGPQPSPDGKWLAFYRGDWRRSGKDNGYLAVMPAEGGEIRDLSAPLDRDPTDFSWDQDSRSIVFTAGSWGDTQAYRVMVESGAIETATTGRMMIEQIEVGPEGGIAFSASTPANPSELFWQAGGAAAQALTELNRKFLDEVIVQEVHEMRFKAPDGSEVQGWYLYPVGYEQGKKYPLAMNVHGGPHVMWGPSARTMFHEWQFHAASGYAVFFCNPRGGDGYGAAWKAQLHGAWGHADMPDLMAGVDTLLAMGFVDEKRLALTGGSYGGFQTAWIVSHTDRFACAVAQRGVYNIVSFHGTADIPGFVNMEFGTEVWEDPQKLWENSPVAHAHKIKTPLLISHQENDFRVPIEQAEQLFAIVRRATDTPVEMWRFPREGHELSRSGDPRLRIKRLEKMVGWFDKYCK